MACHTVLTALPHTILLFFLVFFHLRKTQTPATIMNMEPAGKCGGGCAGCAHSKSCHSEKKEL